MKAELAVLANLVSKASSFQLQTSDFISSLVSFLTYASADESSYLFDFILTLSGSKADRINRIRIFCKVFFSEPHRNKALSTVVNLMKRALNDDALFPVAFTHQHMAQTLKSLTKPFNIHLFSKGSSLFISPLTYQEMRPLKRNLLSQRALK